jgi:hypothetical protein
MSNLISGSYLAQDTLQLCIWTAFLALAVAAQTALAEENAFATSKYSLTDSVVNPAVGRQYAYRFNADVALNRPDDAMSANTWTDNTPRLPNFTEQKTDDDWSINIQKQAPSSSDCSTSTTLPCLTSKNDQAPEIKPQQESYWVVLRKAFHF